MSPSTSDIKKRPGQSGVPILVRVQPSQLEAVDAWIKSQSADLSRPEAIRRLVDMGLKGR